MVGANTQNGNIYIWITTDKTRIKFAAIRQGHLNAPCLRNYMGIGENLTIRGKDEAGANASTKLWYIERADTSTISIYINAYYRRPNSFRRCGYCIRIGIQRPCILFICAHHQCYAFLWNHSIVACVRGSDSMSLILIVSHTAENVCNFFPERAHSRSPYFARDVLTHLAWLGL